MATIIKSNRSYGQELQRKISEEYTDPLGNIKPAKTYIIDADFANQAEIDAVLAASDIAFAAQDAANEVNKGIQDCYAGIDPLNSIPFNPIGSNIFSCIY